MVLKIIFIKNLFPSKSFTKDAIFHCEDYIEGKRVTIVDELKEHGCSNAIKETCRGWELRQCWLRFYWINLDIAES